MSQRAGIIIPTLNEAETIPDVVGRCLALSAADAQAVSVYVVDRGSVDGTVEAARRRSAAGRGFRGRLAAGGGLTPSTGARRCP